MPFPWDEEEAEDEGGLSQMTEEEKQASLKALMEHVNW